MARGKTTQSAQMAKNQAQTEKKSFIFRNNYLKGKWENEF